MQNRSRPPEDLPVSVLPVPFDTHNLITEIRVSTLGYTFLDFFHPLRSTTSARRGRKRVRSQDYAKKVPGWG